jgi:FtsH-binding integral membrane protein
MSDYHPQARSIPAGSADMSVDAGLRAFMLGVYSKMGLGLVWSALLAYAVGAYAPLTQLVFGSPLFFVIQWGPVALLMFSNIFMRNPSPVGSAVLYWSVVTLMGAGLGIWVFLAMTRGTAETLAVGHIAPTFSTIAMAFFATAAAFGGLSLIGYMTKRNLSGLGSMLIMATWGLFAIGLANIFIFK